jgi:hypothetical protein
MRAIRFSCATLLALFVFSLSAHALLLDTLTFVNDGSQLTGAIFPVNSAHIPGVGAITFFDGTTSYTFAGATSTENRFSNDGDNYDIITFENTNGDILELGVFSDTPSTRFDEVLCSTANPCTSADSSSFISEFIPESGGGPFDVNAGNIILTQGDTVATTPEPSSIVLMGTGILGLAGAARRKFVKA